MCKKLVVIAAMLFAVVAQPVFAGNTGNNGRYDCYGRRDGRACDPPPTTPPPAVTPVPIINNNQPIASAAAGASASSSSASNSVANGGTGGAGGAGGNGTGGSVSIGDVGSGNANNITYAPFSEVQVAPLPDTIHNAIIKAVAEGPCGPRVNTTPVQSFSAVVPVGLSFYKNKDIPTGLVKVTGFKTGKEAFDTATLILPPPSNEKLVFIMGQRVYGVLGVNGVSGGSSAAANFANGSTTGIGASITSSNSYGYAAQVVYDCTFKEFKAEPLPQAKIGLESEKTPVLAASGHQVLVKKPTKPRLCNGKPIPEGYECAYVRDRVNVIKNVGITSDGKK